jgi:mxaA protein
MNSHEHTVFHPRFNMMFAYLLASIVLCFNLIAQADDSIAPTIADGLVQLNIQEAERDVGYTVGDIIPRTVTLKVKKPYQLMLTSLPIVGYERRYKGQIIGVELSSIQHASEDDGDYNSYVLHLAYQVFTNNIVAKPAFLPAEIVKFTKPASGNNKAEVVQYRIPEWGFRISPLAIYGSVKIEDDMSPLRGPLLLNADAEKFHLKVLYSVLGFSLLGLLYILGQRAWLPLMGRPFAKALRQIKKLPNSDEGLKQAVSLLHKALDSTLGSAVFSNNLAYFMAEKPAFSRMQHELEQFFQLSRQVFFEAQAQPQLDLPPQAWLLRFCRQCRDCERGLQPDLSSQKA